MFFVKHFRVLSLFRNKQFFMLYINTLQDDLNFITTKINMKLRPGI